MYDFSAVQFPPSRDNLYLSSSTNTETIPSKQSLQQFDTTGPKQLAKPQQENTSDADSLFDSFLEFARFGIEKVGEWCELVMTTNPEIPLLDPSQHSDEEDGNL